MLANYKTEYCSACDGAMPRIDSSICEVKTQYSHYIKDDVSPSPSPVENVIRFTHAYIYTYI